MPLLINAPFGLNSMMSTRAQPEMRDTEKRDMSRVTVRYYRSRQKKKILAHPVLLSDVTLRVLPVTLVSYRNVEVPRVLCVGGTCQLALKCFSTVDGDLSRVER